MVICRSILVALLFLPLVAVDASAGGNGWANRVIKEQKAADKSAKREQQDQRPAKASANSAKSPSGDGGGGYQVASAVGGGGYHVDDETSAAVVSRQGEKPTLAEVTADHKQ